MYRIIVSSLVLLLGLALLGAGIWLAVLGGSWFYIVLGAGLAVSAVLMLQRQAVGLGLYAATLLVTLIWALWEVGLDWWALSARGSLLIILGLLLLLPPMVRAMHRPEAPRARYGYASMALAASLLISAAVGVTAMLQTPYDVAGAFPQERFAAAGEVDTAVPAGEWAAYGGTAAGRRYSPLEQITPENVAELEVAWKYQTGDTRRPEDPGEMTYEVTPLVVEDTLYLCTPHSVVIALDPVTGEEKWRFDPQLRQPPRETTQHMTCRGVSYYDGSAAPDGAPAPGAQAEQAPGDELDRLALSASGVTTEAAGVPQNVVTGNAQRDAPNPRVNREEGLITATPPGPSCVKRLFAPTADGRLISISAETGEICPGFGGEDGTVNLWANMPNVTPGSHYSTSPPVVTDRLVIVGGTVNDNSSATAPSGVIRAYDVNSGALVWNFDSENPEATEPIPDGETYTENAPNFWSVASYDPELRLVYIPMGNRSPDQFGGSRSENAERFSSSILALEADTGRVAWVFRTVHHDLWDYDVPAQPSLVDLTIEGETVPALVTPTKQGDVFVLDRRTGEPVLPVEERPVPQGAAEGDFTAPTQPASALNFRPSELTGADMWGVTPLDQLACRISFRRLDYRGIYTPPSVDGTLVYPGNFGTFNWGGVAVDPNRQIMFAMPVYLAFTVRLVPRSDPYERVVTEEGEPIINENFGAPYAVDMGPFFSWLGLPCQRPPWGYVAGVDLTTGDVAYKHVNGTVRDLAPVPLPFEMGVPGIGGPIVTKGGVAFLSGTLDYYVRGYDLQTGREVWRARLPAGGQATPATYLGADGRQYLVVVAGGHGSTGTREGDSIIAYALPEGGSHAASAVSAASLSAL